MYHHHAYDRQIIFLLAIIIGVPEMQAQSDRKLDSLLNRLDQPCESDSQHALAYEDIIWHYIELADEEKIWAYLDSLRSFGNRANYSYTKLLYEFNVGYFYFRASMYDSALVHMYRTSQLADDLGYPKQKVNALFRIATLLHFTPLIILSKWLGQPCCRVALS